MYITSLSASSFNTFDQCAFQYFLKYGLGMRDKSGQAAEKGTIVHKMMEILALEKLALQTKEPLSTLLKEDEYLIDGLKNIRDYYSKENYDAVFSLVYDDHVNKSEFKYTDKDRSTLRGWFDRAREFQDGAFNPLNKDIIAPEQFFEVPLPDDWAAYTYVMPDGEVLSGQLKLRGIIDVVSKVDADTYEILDYKTGSVMNWKTYKTKDYNDILNEFQLQLYYLVSRIQKPDVKSVICTIYYLAHDTVFTVAFDNIDKIKTKIKNQFNKIRSCTKPKCLDKQFCSRVCYFGKTKYEQGGDETICQHYRKMLEKYGMEETIKLCQKKKD